MTITNVPTGTIIICTKYILIFWCIKSDKYIRILYNQTTAGASFWIIIEIGASFTGPYFLAIFLGGSWWTET